MQRILVAAFSAFALVAFNAHSASCPQSKELPTNIGDRCEVNGALSTFTLLFTEGFDDGTSVTRLGGDNNQGNTVGQQRKMAFIKAAEILANQIKFDVPGESVIVDARFSNLECESNAATLGSAGATTYLAPPTSGSSSNGAWQADTYYPIALFNHLKKQSQRGSLSSDIRAKFNANLGAANCLSGSGWYYGFDAPPSNRIGFVTVLLHEMLHGMGISSLVNVSTGAKANGLNDVFSNQLSTLSTLWKNANDAQRRASITSVNGLLWNGASVNSHARGKLNAGFNDNNANGQFDADDRVQMFAPSAIQSGSSVSHFDTAVSPNELMEPEYTKGSLDIGLALYALKDIGWGIKDDSQVNAAPVWSTPSTLSTNEDTVFSANLNDWVADADTPDSVLTLRISTCPANLRCQLSSDHRLEMTPNADFFGQTDRIHLEADDGQHRVSTSFTLRVNPVNDAPSLSIEDQTVNANGSLTLDLSASANDVEGDALSFRVKTCASNITCALSGTQLTLTPSPDYSNPTNLIEVVVSDVLGAQTTARFNLAVQSPLSWSVIAPIRVENTQNMRISLADYVNTPGLSFSVTGCDAALHCTINNGELSVTANQYGEYRVSVSASDGNHIANTVIVVRVPEPPTLMHQGRVLNRADEHTLGLTEERLSLTQSPQGYTYRLSLDGNDVSSLVRVESQSIGLTMPTRGQFAGRYELTLSQFGREYRYTFMRPLRTTLNVEHLLAEKSAQPLLIEGGRANTVYTLTTTNAVVRLQNANGQPIDRVQASNDRATFNRARVWLQSPALTANAQDQVRIDGGGLNATKRISMLPVHPLTLSFYDSLGNAVSDVTLTLLDQRLNTRYAMRTRYDSGSRHTLTLALPNVESNLTARVQASGFAYQDIVLSDQQDQRVLFERAAKLTLLSGYITSYGSVDFSTELPVVEVEFTDGSRQSAVVALTHAQHASFRLVFDATQHLLTKLHIRHRDTHPSTYSLLNGVPSRIELTPNNASSPQGSSTSGGGLPLTHTLVLMLVMLMRRITLSHSSEYSRGRSNKD